MEFWDLYDKNRTKTNEVLRRGNPLPEGAYHLVVLICLFNAKNEMLIQQRQTDKAGWPGMWDITVVGSAVAGETSETAAQRELLEEIGYGLDFQNIRPRFTEYSKTAIKDYYLIEKDIDINTLTLQREEVQRVRWADKEEIWTMIDKGEFVPYYKSLIALCFEMKGTR